MRATEDVDIVIRRSPANDAALFAALRELHAQWIGNERDPATGMEQLHPVTLSYVQSTRLMMLITDEGFLDIFDFVPGLPEMSADELFETSIEVQGRRFVSLALLRRIKAAAARPKHLLDLANLPDDRLA